jgi:hypothetical protein
MCCEVKAGKRRGSVDQQQGIDVLGAHCEERTWRESIMRIGSDRKSLVDSVLLN